MPGGGAHAVQESAGIVRDQDRGLANLLEKVVGTRGQHSVRTFATHHLNDSGAQHIGKGSYPHPARRQRGCRE